jgi:hypothetical protein
MPEAALKVTWDQTLAWRVGRQLLNEREGTVVDAARRLAGVQAQVTSSAELAIGIRTGAHPAQVRDALWKDRVVVKTWAMRGTLHLLPSDEIPTWVTALRAKERQAKRGSAWERYHGLTVEQLNSVTETVGQVLKSNPMTREELGEAVASATGDKALSEVIRTGFGGSILKSAAADGSLCFGPDRGRNVTFVDPKEWLLTPWHEPDLDDAMHLVVHRFLDGYGPASATDFAHWWGVTPADGKKLFRPFTKELVPVELDGEAVWVTDSGAEALRSVGPLREHVRLVPGFDSYVFAPRGHRRHTWPDGLHHRISRAAGWITPAVVANGRIAGVWAYDRKGDSVSVQIEPLAPLSESQRAEAERHAHSYEALLDAPVEIDWVEQLGAGHT